MKKQIYIFCGARPNFIKVSSLHNVLKKNYKIKIIHLGQHQDYLMSDIFFKNLNLPKPYKKFSLIKKTSVGRVAEMIEYLDIFLKKEINQINFGIVVGDVDATFASSYCLNRNKIKFAHVEAGLRSKNKYMPEEINRVVSDHLADYLFTTTHEAKINLIKEGLDKKNIFFVGNIMIDTLYNNLTKIKKLNLFGRNRIKENEYILLTIHRNENTKDLKKIDKFIHELTKIFSKKIIYVLHPRVINSEYKFKKYKNVIFTKPLGYLNFISLINKSYFVMTDSGGISEECSILGKICLTLRDRTERPETVKFGTNKIVNFDINKIVKTYSQIKNNSIHKNKIKYWDGKSSLRIQKILNKIL